MCLRKCESGYEKIEGNYLTLNVRTASRDSIDTISIISLVIGVIRLSQPAEYNAA